GILGALRRREAIGRGTHVVTSLFDTALAWTSYHAIGYLATGRVPGPHGSGLAMIAPYEAFPTDDGQVMIAAGTDELFRRTCRALDAPDVAGDARFRDNAHRVEHRHDLFRALARTTRALSTEDALRRLQDAGVPCAPIRSMDQVLDEPQVQHNGMLVPVPHPGIPDFRAVALPVQWDGARPTPRRAPPLLGQHTDEVLRELGFAPDEIERLDERGAIQRHRPA
ncbi:MAG: CoA transferase, partial [Gammaproteobacteria bacterium]|nr:CoA transferase [Gemmatimonadota bacterium]NIU79557.1 CoA transferase [Gammaproteobacteria bacterium]NIY12566.1 CoA transferase [Gemmatimonadota bacterium]